MVTKSHISKVVPIIQRMQSECKAIRLDQPPSPATQYKPLISPEYTFFVFIFGEGDDGG